MALGQISCGGEPATIVGTEGPDVIEGTREPDVIAALGGDDEIRANHRDVVCAGDGDDRVETHGIKASVYAGDGNDDVQVQGLRVSASGDAGDDVMSVSVGDLLGDPYRTHRYLGGGEGDDAIQGSEWGDSLVGGPGSDLMEGGAGGDSLEGTGSQGGELPGDIDTLSGGSGGDRVFGHSSREVFTGGPGSDRFFDVGPDDEASGGDGDDFFRWTGGDVDVSGDLGTDRLEVVLLSVTLDLSQGVASSPQGGASIDGLEEVEGTVGDDVLIGDDASNLLYGHKGDDQIRGGGGDDTLIGGRDTWCSDVVPDDPDDGADSILGGGGNDWLFGGDTGCWGWEDEGDEIQGGPGEDSLYGAQGPDVLLGQEGADFLHGGEGTNAVDAGSGDDRCVDSDSPVACEFVLPPTPCSDGIDNDYDGTRDHGQDEGCSTFEDDYEGLPQPGMGEYLDLVFDTEKEKFVGYYGHAEPRCVLERHISVKKKRPGSDLLIGTMTAVADGRWILKYDPRPGRYYAFARPSTFTTEGGELVTCPARTSYAVVVER